MLLWNWHKPSIHRTVKYIQTLDNACMHNMFTPTEVYELINSKKNKNLTHWQPSPTLAFVYKEVLCWSDPSYIRYLPVPDSFDFFVIPTQAHINGQSRFVGMEQGRLDWISKEISFRSASSCERRGRVGLSYCTQRTWPTVWNRRDFIFFGSDCWCLFFCLFVFTCMISVWTRTIVGKWRTTQLDHI